MITAVRHISRACACLALLALAACNPPQFADSAPGSAAALPGAYPPPLPPQDEWPNAETLLLGGPPAAQAKAEPVSPPPPPPPPPPPAPRYTQEPAPEPAPLPPLPEAAQAAIRDSDLGRFAPQDPRVQSAPAPAAENPAPVTDRTMADAARPAPAPKAEPAPAAVKPAAPPPAQADAKGIETRSKLGEALLAELARAKLALPQTLAKDEVGAATLDLPADFIDRLRAEAGKLGLGREASTADLRITLKGDGYVIRPAGAQIAPLKSGQSPRFSWTVSDTDPAVNAPLAVEIAAILKGRGKPQTIEIASLPAPPIEAPIEAAKAKASGAGVALLIPLLLIIAAVFFLGLWARDRQKEKGRKEGKETPLEL